METHFGVLVSKIVAVGFVISMMPLLTVFTQFEYTNPTKIQSSVLFFLKHNFMHKALQTWFSCKTCKIFLLMQSMLLRLLTLILNVHKNKKNWRLILQFCPERSELDRCKVDYPLGVTFVTIWDEEHLLKNIQYAMIMEMMGLGPMKYCIVYNDIPNFFSKLLLLLLYLPHKKMCFYPPRFFFDAPFDHSPWMEIGDAIHSHQFYLKNSIFCTVYYTQQFVVFQRIGVYGRS